MGEGVPHPSPLPRRERGQEDGGKGVDLSRGVAFCCISVCYCHVVRCWRGERAGGKEERRRGFRRRCCLLVVREGRGCRPSRSVSVVYDPSPLPLPPSPLPSSGQAARPAASASSAASKIVGRYAAREHVAREPQASALLLTHPQADEVAPTRPGHRRSACCCAGTEA